MDRYRGAQWSVGASGAPWLDGALVTIDCLLDEAILLHSHAIVLGKIVGLRVADGAEPLLYWQRGFHALPGQSIRATGS